jgi:predicted DNA-binding transcriptional regulator AlpA
MRRIIQLRRHRRLLTERQVAAMLNVAPHTLAVWRTSNKGPAFLKLGRAVRYDEMDVYAYMDNARTNAASH